MQCVRCAVCIPRAAYFSIQRRVQLLLAKSLCSCREWLRASAALQRCRSSMCVFFRNYCKYMAGEKAKSDAEAGRREALESVESSNMCAAVLIVARTPRLLTPALQQVCVRHHR